MPVNLHTSAGDMLLPHSRLKVSNFRVFLTRNLVDVHSDMFFILVNLTVSDIHVYSRSTSVYLAGIYCHQIISIWNALPHSDSGVTAPTLSNFNSCVRTMSVGGSMIAPTSSEAERRASCNRISIISMQRSRLFARRLVHGLN